MELGDKRCMSCCKFTVQTATTHINLLLLPRCGDVSFSVAADHRGCRGQCTKAVQPGPGLLVAQESHPRWQRCASAKQIAGVERVQWSLRCVSACVKKTVQLEAQYQTVLRREEHIPACGIKPAEQISKIGKKKKKAKRLLNSSIP